MSAQYSPHVSRFSARLVSKDGDDDYAFREAADELSCVYQPILAEVKVRLLELRRDWSEIGALHQLRDELCVAWSLYAYIGMHPMHSEHIAKRLTEATEQEIYEVVHPKAQEYLLKDQQVFEKWLKLSPFAISLIPQMAADQCWNKQCHLQARLKEISEEEKLSEVGSLYFLIEELAAETAVEKWKARRETWRFFRNSIPHSFNGPASSLH